MAKFKVGDRVRRVSNFTSWAPKGFESVVREVSGGLRYTDFFGDQNVCLHGIDWELVVPGPVREVTRKEIVPGRYGIVSVGPVESDKVHVSMGGFGMVMQLPYFTADELTAAIETLTQVRDALVAA